MYCAAVHGKSTDDITKTTEKKEITKIDGDVIDKQT